MKTLYSLILALLNTTIIACGTDKPEDIRITTRNDWWLTISPNGTFGISSLVDSNPLSMVGTKEGVIDYKVLKQKITGGQKFTDQKPENESIALVDKKDKFVVSEDIMQELLRTAGNANKWQGAGLNRRLLELLDKRPILKSKEMQSKALQPTEGAVAPEKP